MEKTSTHSKKTSFINTEKNIGEEKQSEPREEIIRNILAYSKALKVEKSEKAGTISFVLN